MSRLIFTLNRGSDVTQEQLKACADLFSKNYGVWGKTAQSISPFLKEGQQNIDHIPPVYIA